MDSVTRRLKKHLNPFLGTKALERFNTDLIRKWLAWLNSREDVLAQSSQRDIFDLLSSILDAAVRDGRLRVNPCLDKSISRPTKGEGKVKPWPVSRMQQVKLALPARHQIVTTLGGGLGLRQGEIFAFSMDNIDREKMIYHCTRQLTTVNGVPKFKLPKGHKVRDIPVGVGALEELDAYAENYPPVKITLPWAERDGRATDTVNVLMTNVHDGLYSRQAFNRLIWRPAFARAGLTFEAAREDGMHALRHLFASHMLAQGVSVKELAAYLGHSDEGFTLRTYVHLMPNSYERARFAMDTMIKPRRKRTRRASGDSEVQG